MDRTCVKNGSLSDARTTSAQLLAYFKYDIPAMRQYCDEFATAEETWDMAKSVEVRQVLASARECDDNEGRFGARRRNEHEMMANSSSSHSMMQTETFHRSIAAGG